MPRSVARVVGDAEGVEAYPKYMDLDGRWNSYLLVPDASSKSG
jgi:hypothetical protein